MPPVNDRLDILPHPATIIQRLGWLAHEQLILERLLRISREALAAREAVCNKAAEQPHAAGGRS